MNGMEEVLSIVRQICPHTDIGPDTELVESGILTSLDFFELISELEKRFDMQIEEDLIDAENFRTAETIIRTVLGGRV